MIEKLLAILKCQRENQQLCTGCNSELIIPLILYIDSTYFNAIIEIGVVETITTPIFAIVDINDQCLKLKPYQIIPNGITEPLPIEELISLYLQGLASLAPLNNLISLSICEITGYQALPATCVRKVIEPILVDNYYYIALVNQPVNGNLVDFGVSQNFINKSTLHYSLGISPTHGSVVIDEFTSNFVYTPNENYSGMDFFTVVVWNQYGEQTEVVVSIQVNGTPQVNDEIYNVIQNTSFEGTIEAVNPIGGVLTYQVTTPPTKGTAIFPDPLLPDFTYSLTDSAYIGVDSFAVSVTNILGLTSQLTIYVQIQPIHSLDADVGVIPYHYELIKNSLLKYHLFTNTHTTDTFSYHITNENPALGEISNLVIAPDTRSATFDYQVLELGMDKLTITVENNQTGVMNQVLNDIVVINLQNVNPITATQDIITAPTETIQGQFFVQFNENNHYHFLRGRHYSTNHGGYVEIVPEGSSPGELGQLYQWTYYPSLVSNFDQVNAGIITPIETQELLFNIDISTLPVVIEQSNTTQAVKNGSTSGQIIAVDPYHQTMIYYVVTLPLHGTITNVDNEGNYTYQPNLNYIGEDHFTIGILNSVGTTNVLINLVVYDPSTRPVIYDYQPNPINAYPGLSSAGLLFVDSTNPPLSYSLTMAPSFGSVTLIGDGLFEYISEAVNPVEDSFTITVTDSIGQTDSITIPISVSKGNLFPVIYADLQVPIDVYLDTPVQFMIYAFNLEMNPSNALIYTISVQGTKGTATITSDGLVTYTPNGEVGIDRIEITAENELGLKSTILVYVNVLNHVNPY